MNRTRTFMQLVIFAFVSVLVVYYTAFQVLGIKVANGPFPVSVQLSQGGGIFKGSEVAYRGVAVGRVTSVRLESRSVTLKLAIDHGTKIPANSVAHVYDLSVVGEQYLDFTPPAEPSTQLLHSGSAVPMSNTTTPLPVADALYDLEQWIASINPADIATFTTEGAKAFANTGPELRSILDDTTALISQLTQTKDQTSSLLRNSATLLSGVASHASDFDTFTAALQGLSATLAQQTPAINQFIDESAPTTVLVNNIIAANGNGLSVLFAGLATFGHVLAADVPALKALLVALPDFAQIVPKVVVGNHINGLGLINTGYPVCNTGIPLSNPLSGAQTPVKAVTCPPTTGLLARGAANAPAIPGTSVDSAGETVIEPTAQANGTGSVQVGSYDPTSGDMTAQDGSVVHFGTDGGQAAVMGADSWQAVLAPALGY